jgi:hypothetical protein
VRFRSLALLVRFPGTARPLYPAPSGALLAPEGASYPVTQDDQRTRVWFRDAERPSGAPRPSTPKMVNHLATRTGPSGTEGAPRRTLGSASRRVSSRNAQPGRGSSWRSPRGNAHDVVRGIGACNPVVKDEHPSFVPTCRGGEQAHRPADVALHGASPASTHRRRAHCRCSLPTVRATGEPLTLPKTRPRWRASRRTPSNRAPAPLPPERA